MPLVMLLLLVLCGWRCHALLMRSSFDRISMQIVSYQSWCNCNFQRLSLHPRIAHTCPTGRPAALIHAHTTVRRPSIMWYVWNRIHSTSPPPPAQIKHFTQIFHYIHLCFGIIFFDSLLLFVSVSSAAFHMSPSPSPRIGRGCSHFIRRGEQYVSQFGLLLGACVICAVLHAHRSGLRRRKRPISHNFSITFTFI